MARCRKRKFRDRIAALVALAEVRRHGSDRHTERSAYRCPKCNAWHLTSKAPTGGFRHG